MRTLATQVRLRRLMRVHGEYFERLAAAPSDGELAQLARARLAQLTDDVRRSWLADLAATGSARRPSRWCSFSAAWRMRPPSWSGSGWRLGAWRRRPRGAAEKPARS